jgi:hypothetical protein
VRTAAFLVAFVVAGLAFAGEVTPLSPAAMAQEKRKKDDEERRRNQMLKQLEAIGGEFGAKFTDKLVNRIAKGGKLSLTLDGKSGDYASSHATTQLQEYFDSLQTLSVDTTGKKVRIVENVASFPVTLRKKGSEKEQSKNLTVQIDSESPFALQKLTLE